MTEETLAGRRILIVDDEEVIVESCRAILERCGCLVDGETDGIRGHDRALHGVYDLVLLDVRLPGTDGLEILAAVRERRSDLEVIVITGYSTVEAAVRAVKLGAFDFLPKPFTPDELLARVRSAFAQLDQRRPAPAALPGEIEGIVSVSPAMEEVRAIIARVAGSDATVLIHGETGTGKELVASLVHGASPRRDGPFVSVDCSALAPGLLESELFGHVKGSFTGALTSKPGLFELAQHGTLFLDEVCNLSLETQGKLLRFLESGEFRPVGGVEVKWVNFRLVAATNRDLAAMVEEGSFRQDLFYRMNVVPLHLPPLRERPSDIPGLIRHFLRKHGTPDAARPWRFSPEALEVLKRYSWPGNVRELKNLVERLCVMVEGDTVRVEHLPAHFAGPARGPTEDVPRTNEELKSLKRTMRSRMFDDVERRFVIEALTRSEWNVSRAARETGLQRTNFHALMRKHRIRGKGPE
ncbi:MAG: sigma-54 dependent transcriptional regulator [Acidobacteriia bacterium]|nr:sigma-54 dependent transcriptional regulator [Terriglobia bacterium]